MGNCVFTIVAKNYIGLAQILEHSIKQYYKNVNFYVIVADEFEERRDYPDNAIEAKKCLDIPEDLWVNMSFKYDLTEFCTSIKPASFLYFLEKYEKVIYLDPDILFYGSIERIFTLLDSYKLLLTPHITQYSLVPRSDSPENIWLKCGIFNLGFCAIRKSFQSINMLRWWHNRLIKGCFSDAFDATYTDQKWMDFVPALCAREDLLIIQDLGYNVAPWNFFERKLHSTKGGYYVSYRFGEKSNEKFPLLFVHYSGYNYKALLEGNIEQRNIPNLKAYDDIKSILDYYVSYLKEYQGVFLSYIDSSYSYNSYSDNTPVHPIHRRIYRSLTDKGRIFENPFSIDNDSLYSLLKRRKILTVSPMNVTKITDLESENFSSKLKLLNICFLFVFKLIGIGRYLLLLRFLRRFSRYESQLYILDKQYATRNIL